MDNTKSFSIKTLLILAGSYVSFGIGSGFATGVELLQFWAPHGLPGIFGIIISALLILLCIYVVSRDCRKYKLVDMEMMYKHYCGKYIGLFIKWFNIFTFFLLVGSMISGGAASLNQAFNLPIFAGTLIMLIVVMATALMGMKRLTDVLGNIAPIILIAVLIICFYSYFNATDTLTAGDQLIRDKSGLAMSSSLIFSAFLNFTYVVLNMSAYSANVSTRADHQKELVWGKCSRTGCNRNLPGIYFCRIYLKCIPGWRYRHSSPHFGTAPWNRFLRILWNYCCTGYIHNSNRHGMGSSFQHSAGNKQMVSPNRCYYLHWSIHFLKLRFLRSVDEPCHETCILPRCTLHNLCCCI